MDRTILVLGVAVVGALIAYFGAGGLKPQAISEIAVGTVGTVLTSLMFVALLIERAVGLEAIRRHREPAFESLQDRAESVLRQGFQEQVGREDRIPEEPAQPLSLPRRDSLKAR